MDADPGPARDRILMHLKMRGPQTAAELAGRLGVTPIAIRQHTQRLIADGLVTATDDASPAPDASAPRAPGRPARRFALSDAARARFPDTHADLTVELLAAVRDAFGEAGLSRVIARRTRAQRRVYTDEIPGPDASLPTRLEALARIRTREGYLAELRPIGDGGYELIENHCPICAAATVCQKLCRDELAVFRRVLGRDVTVVRREHIPAGARRCVYEIRPRAAGARSSR